MNRTETNQPEALIAVLNRIQQRAFIVGGVGVLLCILGAWLNLPQFFRSYLFAWLFWLGLGLGSFAWLMMHHLTAGRWGFVTRRILEVSALVTLLMALLYLPFLFALPQLYPWARPDVVAADPLLLHKRPYLNAPFFISRAGFYFVSWIVIAFLMDKWSRDWDRTGDIRFGQRLRLFSSFALIVYALTISFAAIDWIMALDPHWFSTIFGMLVVAEQGLTAWCFAIIMLVVLTRITPLADVVTRRDFNDLGNFLLAALLFWGYLAFVQWLIVWAGNLPDENIWFIQRINGGWQWVAILVVFLHFVLPFAALLSGRLKRRGALLALVAGLLLVADLIYLYWLVTPAFYPGQFHLHWLDFVAPATIGGLWLTVFVWWLKRRELLPIHDIVLDQTIAPLQEV